MKQNLKKTKNTFRVYAAWDFELEAEEFNRMSEKGWQLVVGGCFHQKYIFDDSVTYRYQIDFHNKIPDMARYDETFLDAGWERVSSTFNDWHIFRKVYDPGLPAEEYEIYTDEDSRVEMLKRWRRIFTVIALLQVPSLFNLIDRIWTGQLNFVSGAALQLMYVFLAFMIISAFVGINNLINGRKNTYRFPITPFLGIMLVLLAVCLCADFVLGNESLWFALGFLTSLVLLTALIIVIALVYQKSKYSKTKL